jgi:hypothetical protein
MICPRYVVFDDAPQGRRLGWTADQFAEALRCPLAAIGVRVVRQHGAGATSPRAGFQAHGWLRSQYNAKLNVVDHVVNGVTKSADLPREDQPNVLSA